jgi:outer membrane biosynthesis protein TonB
MNLPARIAAWLLPLLLLTACTHKTHPTQDQALAPPIIDAPPPKPAPTTVELPPPVMTIPSQAPAPAANANAQPEEKPKPPLKHKRTSSKNTQQAANTAPQAATEAPAVSAIGQLSSGDPSDLRKETVDSIAAIERGLNGIGRSLSDQEQKTAAQIREFLKQARAALTSGDVDGAHTLAAKAKVLLGELGP